MQSSQPLSLSWLIQRPVYEARDVHGTHFQKKFLSSTIDANQSQICNVNAPTIDTIVEVDDHLGLRARLTCCALGGTKQSSLPNQCRSRRHLLDRGCSENDRRLQWRGALEMRMGDGNNWGTFNLLLSGFSIQTRCERAASLFPS